METWRQALENHISEDADNVDDNIKIENKESEVDSDRAQTMGYTTQDFLNGPEVPDIMTNGMEKSTSHRNTNVFAGLVNEKGIEAPQVRYNGARKGVKTSFFNVVGETIVDMI